MMLEQDIIIILRKNKVVVVTDSRHSPSWWKEAFGKMIQKEFGEVLTTIINHIERSVIMGRKEFTKEEVIKMIDEISPPTPTDAKHDAVWWNTTFGQSIRSEFERAKGMLIEEINLMVDY